jgi:hypothetical protein
MKLSASAPGSGREQMRERQRRGRASVAPLRALYPQFASLRLEFDFRDDAPFTPVPQVTVLHPPARAYFVFPCPYADCDGEFDLSSAVTGLANGGETHTEGHLKCCGSRSAGGQGRAPCKLALEFALIAQIA